MAWLILGALGVALVVGPSLWVQRVLHKYSRPLDRYADRGTAAELAEHLITSLELGDVRVEPTETGDHYDPDARAVRLARKHFDACSLTAITIAAHEVGHAMQHARGERMFRLRQRLARTVMQTQRLSGGLIFLMPVVAGVTRQPALASLLLVAVVGTALLGTLVHLVTLPVEFDASFGKALPVLERGRYLKSNDHVHARRILRAAALTYVAGSLLGLVNFWRWLRLLRR